MSGTKSPLRDRLLSNSPDPIKSSIIRDSGMGWISPSNTGNMNSGTSGSITSPLRIEKRESPRLSQSHLARRSSSSYKHVTRNNLVSKSPFKSRVPESIPSPRAGVVFPISRRVSGEKRPRPPSIHEQAEAENERPLALKRERRQSRVYQGLIQKEHVTKSPFRQRTPSAEATEPLPPPLPLLHLIPKVSSVPDAPLTLAPPVSHIHNSSVSPGRPSLVSRRMHGPRRTNSGRRQRRKTVTFDERCDVVEFDRDEGSDEEVFFLDHEQGSDNSEPEAEACQEESDPFFRSEDNLEDMTTDRREYHSNDSIELPDLSHDGASLLGMALDSDASISGLVDEMFGSAAASNSRHTPSPPLKGTDVPANCGVTPPRLYDHQNFPVDLETEGGISLARSHAIRFLKREHSQSPQPPKYSLSPRHTPPERKVDEPTHLPTSDSLSEFPSTPAALTETNNSTSMVPPKSMQPNASFNEFHRSTPPSILAHRRRVPEGSRESDDVVMLPCTPSPMGLWKKSLENDASILVPIEVPPFDRSFSVSSEELNGPSAGDAILDAPSSSSNSSQESNSLDQRSKCGGPDQVIEVDHIRLAGLEPTGLYSSSPDLRPSPSTESLRWEHANDSRRGADLTRMRRRLVTRHEGSLSASVSPVQLDPASSKQLTESPAEKDDRDKFSMVTTTTDFSAMVEFAEREMPASPDAQCSPVPRSKDVLFGQEESLSIQSSDLVNSSALNFPSLGCNDKPDGLQSLKMGVVDVDMDMRSALDRLMDDVAGTQVDNPISTDGNRSYERCPQSPLNDSFTEQEVSDSALLHHSFASRDVSMSSILSTPPKDSIKSKEPIVTDKRRQAKQEDSNGYTNARPAGKAKRGQELLGVGRPSRRRSMSTGDADRASRSHPTTLDIDGVGEIEGLNEYLGDTIEKELQKTFDDVPHKQRKTKYLVRERQGTIYASSEPDCVSHMAGPGDLDTRKAWRAVRRPSDMNEYSAQIKAYRAQEKPGKAYGKVFVKVLGVKGVHVPLPSEPTSITCTLNNGIHFVSTPECRISRDFSIEQEFELIEHNKLEFTLTLKVRRDPHILVQFKELSTPPPPSQPVFSPLAPTSSRGGMRSFFSSPKKSSKTQAPPPASTPDPGSHRPESRHQKLAENLARYLKPDGTLARAFISFKDIANRCDARLFETSYPLIGQRVELDGKYSTLQIGEIMLQIFRLPPLPGIAPEQLPQSLAECHRGLRHINWHKVTYFEGTLTQTGGDCSTWRRRQFRVIGSNLVAFNDVTKRATVAIDLQKAIAVEDDQEARRNALSPGGRSRVSRYNDDDLYGVERSFRLIFSLDQEIIFFADNDEEKARWLDILRALVGHIPPHPLWAELLWQRQEDLAKGIQPRDIGIQDAPTRMKPFQDTSQPPVPSNPSWLIPKGPQR